MIGKAPVIAVVMILSAAIFIFFLEFFIPLSANFQLRAECRNTLLKMEEKNEFTASMRSDLQDKLVDKGFTIISITNPHTARRGEALNLKVVVDYSYNKLTGIFRRTDVIERMVYDKYTVARKVLN